MTLKQGILVCLLSAVAILSFGQDTATEQTLWSNLHITKSLSNNFSAKVKISYYSTMPVFSPRFIDAGFNYSPKKNLNIGLYYRFKEVFNTSSQRIYAEASYKNIYCDRIGMNFSSRFRVQHKSVIETEKSHVFQFRPQVSISKSLEHLSGTKLYTSLETFHSTNVETNQLKYDRFRLDIGFSYKVQNTPHKVKVYYRYQMDCYEKTEILSMLNMGYRFNF